jgi:hypothetical protein
MKVKDLMVNLSQVDQELEVAVLQENREYWGRIYRRVEVSEQRIENVDGPKKPDRVVFVIE